MLGSWHRAWLGLGWLLWTAACGGNGGTDGDAAPSADAVASVDAAPTAPMVQWGTAGGRESATVVAVAPGGGFYVAGTTTGAFPGATAAGGDDAFLTKVSAAGDVEWTVQWGTSLDDAPIGIAASLAADSPIAADAVLLVTRAVDADFGDQTSPGELWLHARSLDDGQQLQAPTRLQTAAPVFGTTAVFRFTTVLVAGSMVGTILVEEPPTPLDRELAWISDFHMDGTVRRDWQGLGIEGREFAGPVGDPASYRVTTVSAVTGAPMASGCTIHNWDEWGQGFVVRLDPFYDSPGGEAMGTGDDVCGSGIAEGRNGELYLVRRAGAVAGGYSADLLRRSGNGQLLWQIPASLALGDASALVTMTPIHGIKIALARLRDRAQPLLRTRWVVFAVGEDARLGTPVVLLDDASDHEINAVILASGRVVAAVGARDGEAVLVTVTVPPPAQ